MPRCSTRASAIGVTTAAPRVRGSRPLVASSLFDSFSSQTPANVLAWFSFEWAESLLNTLIPLIVRSVILYQGSCGIFDVTELGMLSGIRFKAYREDRDSWTVTEFIPLHKSVTGQVSKLRKHPSHTSRATNAGLHVRTVVTFTWSTPSYPQLLQALGATRITSLRKAPQDQGSNCATSSPLRAART